MSKCALDFTHVPENPRQATQIIVEGLLNKICPLIFGIRSKLQTYYEEVYEDDLCKLQDVYALCVSQITRCFQTLFDIFKREYRDQICRQESRQYIFERLLWCLNRLIMIEEHLEIFEKQIKKDNTSDDSMFVTPMYFVNWIDHTFEVLTKLANIIYKTDCKNNDELYNQWKYEMVECVGSLHISIDELLLSAMTLCRHCLPTDQHIIKTRCQVVLRETKALLCELIDGDLEEAFRASPHLLKLPIMPSNVNVLIDVLRDVLYVLETNTNTALLALLIHCFSNSVSPVEKLKQHFVKSKGMCPCDNKNDNDDFENCSFVKEFDTYNERLLQIGSFAVSCSSDKQRILSLRSSLATLEALDPHLVPALMMSPHSYHSELLMNSWHQEVQDIRNSVFLIVDPAAFSEKSQQLMHQILLEFIKLNSYNNSAVCQIINIGCVVYDFFSMYSKYEPDALMNTEKMLQLLEDLNKVQVECKIVSNLFCSEDDFVYDLNKGKNKKVSLEQLIKRLKLLYTLVMRINDVNHPKDNEDQLFGELEEQDPPVLKNITHTIYEKNNDTYVNSPRKPASISRSIFARTTNTRNSSNFPLLKLTKHLNKRNEMNFSVKLDELFDLSEVPFSNCTGNNILDDLQSVREPSVLYNFSSKKRTSLRKAVLNKHCKSHFEQEAVNKNMNETNIVSKKEELMDETTSLQITDILNQMGDMTSLFSKTRPIDVSELRSTSDYLSKNDDTNSNVLSLNINDESTKLSKLIWSIPVNTSVVKMPMDDSVATTASNLTAPSNVTTLERISDIDLVETRLSSLKVELETSL